MYCLFLKSTAASVAVPGSPVRRYSSRAQCGAVYARAVRRWPGRYFMCHVWVPF